jgi:hypothetical protein
MTKGDPPAEGTSGPPAGEFDWESPRWREGDEVQGDVERVRRFRGDRAPRQRGAIDGVSVASPETSASNAPPASSDEGNASGS